MNPQTRTHNNASAAPQRRKIQFSTNIPCIVRLEFDPPAEARQGRFGDQFMYWCSAMEDGEPCTLFADPPLHELIVASGARANDAIVILKHEIRQGMQRRIQWEVEPFRELGHTARAPLTQPSARSAPAPCAPPAKSAPIATSERPVFAGETGSQARTSPVPAPGTGEPACFPPVKTGNQMADALKLALEACELAGFEARTEDIRALAITIYIQATGGKGR